MNRSTSLVPRWATSSFSHPAEASVLHNDALVEHLSLCGAQHGAWAGLQDGADNVGRLLAERLITAVCLVALLAGASWLAL